jgi:hypothetical protein
MSLHTCAECTTRYAAGLPGCPNCGSAERSRPGTALPSVEVTCRTGGCPAKDQPRQVVLRLVAVGVLHIPGHLGCVRCGRAMDTTRPYTVPSAGGQEEDTMPKITRHGGPSIAPTAPEVTEEGAEPELTGDGTGDGEALPPAEETTKPAKPAGRRARKAAAPPVETDLTVTATAEVTRPDGTTT